MAKSMKINQHQRGFLKKLRLHPAGLPDEHWPAATVLRRWMRHEGFRAALDSTRCAMQVRSDFELVNAGVRASATLSPLLDSADESDVKSKIHTRMQVLRLTHWRLKELRQAGDFVALLESKKPPMINPIHPNVMKNPALAEYLVGRLSGRITGDTPRPPERNSTWRD